MYVSQDYCGNSTVLREYRWMFDVFWHGRHVESSANSQDAILENRIRCEQPTVATDLFALFQSFEFSSELLSLAELNYF